jgi:hypothetical protein
VIQQHQTDSYIKICMKTWLLCESCIHAESTSTTPRYDLIKECSDCAKACFAVVSRLVSQNEDVSDLILNCVLHCRQCAQECDKYKYENDIEFCGDTCGICADEVKNLASFSLN